MKNGKIIKGVGFDWDGRGQRAMDAIAEAANDDGRLEEVPWGAAMHADPGVIKCPTCDTAHWTEGEIMECADCGQWFGVNGENRKKLYSSARKELPRYGLDASLADDPVKARELLRKKARNTISHGGPCGGNEVQMAGRALLLAVLWLIVEGCPDEPIEEFES